MHQSLLPRLYEYSRQRFPLTQIVLLSAAISLPSALGTQAYLFEHEINVVRIGGTWAAVFLLLLRLRLIDDLKDLNHDRLFHPERPVPRGLVRPAEIARLAFATFLLETVVAACAGGVAFMFFAGVAVYSLLTAREFFVRSWLRRHFTLYVVTHEVLVVPVTFYLFSLNGLTFSEIAAPYFWLLTTFITCQLVLVEVVRKLQPAESSPVGARDTYTANYGVRTASSLAAVVAGGCVLSSIVCTAVAGDPVAIPAATGLVLLTSLVYSLIAFANNPILRATNTALRWSACLVLGTSAAFTLTVGFAG